MTQTLTMMKTKIVIETVGHFVAQKMYLYRVLKHQKNFMKKLEERLRGYT